MELAEFVFAAATGVAGSGVYDGVKLILGQTFGKLEIFARNDDKEKFDLVLQTAIESNEAIKSQLEQLQRGENIQILKQQNIHGDNIGRDKIINNK